MVRKFTREELVKASGQVLKVMVDEGGLDKQRAPLVALQLNECIRQLLLQSDEQWARMPAELGAEQALIMVYLINTDVVNGTNFMEQVFEGINKRQSELTLDDVLDFQA